MQVSNPHLAVQVGRAGRDGSEAYCHLFLDDADFLRLRSLAHSDGIDQDGVAAFLTAVFDQRHAATSQNLLTETVWLSSLLRFDSTVHCDAT